jgi:transcriptional regulator with XRE-family HTH domain
VDSTAVVDWRRRATENVARQILLRYSGDMPVALAQKVRTLRVDFRSAAQLADLLGVSRSQVTRWLRGSGIDPLNAEKVDLLELVWSNVLRIYDRDAALAWLFGVNPLLGDRRPVDLIRLGRTEELMRAIRAERSDTFA